MAKQELYIITILKPRDPEYYFLELFYIVTPHLVVKQIGTVTLCSRSPVKYVANNAIVF